MTHPKTPDSPHSLHRILTLKTALLAVSFTPAGILLLMLNAWLGGLELGSWAWVRALPVSEVGGTLLAAGLIGTVLDMAVRRDQEASVRAQFRRVLRDEAPTLRDAVISVFRFESADVARVATPELLDDLATTSLGLRFGDAAFGREVYGDIKHQAIAAEERWHDARVDATLAIARVRGEASNPFFDLLVRWEYRVVPRHRFRKFAVVSDRQRYEELVAQRGKTSVWYRRPFSGFDITDPAVFALESFTIDGVEMPFHRQVDEVSQIYVVDLGWELIQRNQPVTVAFRFRTTASRDAHTFHLSIDRPTRDLDVELHYDSDVVAAMELLDFASRGDGGRVSEEPEHAIVRYRYDGWLFPRAGLVFAWTLQGERQADGSSSEATHAHMQQTSAQLRRQLHLAEAQLWRYLGPARQGAQDIKRDLSYRCLPLDVTSVRNETGKHLVLVDLVPDDHSAGSDRLTRTA